jgi:hypothetical protein
MVGDFIAVEKTWKKNGVLGKLHNLIKYIRLSPQRRQEFKRCMIDNPKWVDFNKLEVSTIEVYLEYHFTRARQFCKASATPHLSGPTTNQRL